MALLTVYSDADNTLWGTDAVYRMGQLRLLEDLEQVAAATTAATDRLRFVRDYDQAIAARHHEHLRYPPGLLAHALILGLRGTSPADAAARVLMEGVLPEAQRAVSQFATRLKEIPPLLPGVEEGIRLAASQGLRLYVVTEGTQERIAKTLSHYGLLEQVSQILSATKTVTLYKRLKTLAGGSGVAMIGDQLDRDVIPACEAGLASIWIPSAFTPEWTDTSHSLRASYVAATFLEAMNWLVEHRSDPVFSTSLAVLTEH
jgi:putative hydrolase of the HAD superfamily